MVKLQTCLVQQQTSGQANEGMNNNNSGGRRNETGAIQASEMKAASNMSWCQLMYKSA